MISKCFWRFTVRAETLKNWNDFDSPYLDFNLINILSVVGVLVVEDLSVFEKKMMNTYQINIKILFLYIAKLYEIWPDIHSDANAVYKNYVISINSIET